MRYPGTGVGTGFQIGGPGEQDPNARKNLQKYLLGKLGAQPNTAGSYASISGQAPGAAKMSTNPFLAMLSGRPGETFQNMSRSDQGGDYQDPGLSAYDPGSNPYDPNDPSAVGGGLTSHYNPGTNLTPGLPGAPAPNPNGSYIGRDGQTSTGQNPQAGWQGLNAQVAKVGGQGMPNFQSQVQPGLGMNIAGLDPGLQAQLMYHIGMIHGAQSG